ncbi:MAG: hypothetical protein UV24_C0007G0020 [Candidatus Nomurabacteria bacterium GW2011_GWA2_42_41]|nr:MAG: hypothetical protein UV24_C0007G0020 [Candidatus Nomurabacteria bacterium GW2011_GWA2_42_41]
MTTIIRNCSTTSKRVKVVIALIYRISDLNTKIDDLENSIKSRSLWNIFLGTPQKQYLKFIRRITIGLLMKRFFCIPRGVLKGCPHILLDAGSALFNAGKYMHSLQCFNCVIESLDRDDQNIRVLALMGRLGCKIVLDNAPLCIEGYEDYLYITSDLHATSQKVREDIQARLARAKLRIGVLEIRNEVESFRKAYNNTF